MTFQLLTKKEKTNPAQSVRQDIEEIHSRKWIVGSVSEYSQNSKVKIVWYEGKREIRLKWGSERVMDETSP
jgi:hypothetical protein